MTTAATIWEREDMLDPFLNIVERAKEDGNYDLVMAQIPSLFGDSDMATYLGFRALGIRPGQAMELLGLGMAVLELWKQETPELIEFEYRYLPELQKNLSADIIRLQFLRNMTLFMFQDSRVIGKSLTEFNELTNREYNYLRSVRRFYSNADLLSLQKALEPEKHRNNTLVLSFGGNQFQVIEAEDGEATIQEVIDVSHEG